MTPEDLKDLILPDGFKYPDTMTYRSFGHKSDPITISQLPHSKLSHSSRTKREFLTCRSGRTLPTIMTAATTVDDEKRLRDKLRRTNSLRRHNVDSINDGAKIGRGLSRGLSASSLADKSWEAMDSMHSRTSTTSCAKSIDVADDDDFDVDNDDDDDDDDNDSCGSFGDNEDLSPEDMPANFSLTDENDARPKRIHGSRHLPLRPAGSFRKSLDLIQETD